MIGGMRYTPCRAVIAVCVIAAILLFVGASSHVTDLLSHGLHPYDWAPGWLNLYWSSLALFDALAAVFLIRGKRRGIDLACVIMATDLAANWYAVYGIQHSSLADQPGLQRLTVFAALVLGTGMGVVDVFAILPRRLAELARYGIDGKASLLRRHGDSRLGHRQTPAPLATLHG
ncbi:MULTISPECIES: hypothetical protein [unclassified Streptomyces]|uniref:hypothetical protein n=1 Tax=unclassified Streptomyces TaxID=2593676 RepID=UPI002888D301|nr:hypothetical protein [Streptomyces sp. DSM 41633]